jgi:hypothetical protein
MSSSGVFQKDYVFGVSLDAFHSADKSNWRSVEQEINNFLLARKPPSITVAVATGFMEKLGLINLYRGRKNRNRESIVALLRTKVQSKLRRSSKIFKDSQHKEVNTTKPQSERDANHGCDRNEIDENLHDNTHLLRMPGSASQIGETVMENIGTGYKYPAEQLIAGMQKLRLVEKPTISFSPTIPATQEESEDEWAASVTEQTSTARPSSGQQQWSASHQKEDSMTTNTDTSFRQGSLIDLWDD